MSFAAFIFQRALAFWVSFRFLTLPLPYSFLCSARTIPLSLCLQYLYKSPGKRHANPHQPKEVPSCPPQCDRHWYTPSGSQLLLFWASIPRDLGAPICTIWLSYHKKTLYLIQMAHVQGNVIIHFNKVSQAIHNAFPTSFTKACHNTLDRIIAIFLLVCQQREYIDQVFTHTLRHRTRFGHCHMFAPPATCWALSNHICLHKISHHQLQCFFHRTSSSRGKLLHFGRRYDIVILPCPTAGAMMRRGWSVLFNIIPCTMLNLPASSFATLSKASRILSSGHSVALTSTLKMLLYSSQSPRNAHLSTCSTYYLAGDSRCHWPWFRSCFSFSASIMNFFAFALSSEKYSHTPCI